MSQGTTESELERINRRIDKLTDIAEDQHNRLNAAAKWLESIDNTIRRMKEVAARYGVNL